ncbi:MAG: bifunctional serine/threonine-protein kinase/formylglycine-generating enzyme family protein [Alistipes sp.]|nr:bifunctional serine/threonine-protein kinase/formylglycine-generating enzyme family protein [Alistipes sp.]
MELREGTGLNSGNYRVIKSLGRGGFAITYLAEQVHTGRKVCIKEFFPENYYRRNSNTSALLLNNESASGLMQRFINKFIKEAQTISRLNHPNIIHIFDTFLENNTAYYVMEYVDGMSVEQYINEHGAMNEVAAVNLIGQVSAALHYIHQQQMLHLDVKPGNIMIRRSDNQAVLIDFGLAKNYDETGSQTSATPICVSHGFTPFEQYQRGGVSSFTPQTDIYSLGATFYFMLVGKEPPAATEVITNGLPAMPQHISENSRNAITAAMQMRCSDRPKSVAEFMSIVMRGRRADGVVKQTDESSSCMSPGKIVLIVMLGIIATVISVGGLLYLVNDGTPYGETYVEDVNGLDMKMIYVEGGTFTMGASDYDYYADDDEYPAHQVTLDSYYIAECEVTQAQWISVMGTRKSGWDDYGGNGDDPAYFICWYEAKDFCEELSRLTGKNYVLPTEAQWEFAARGGNNSNGYTYSGSGFIGDVAYYDDNSEYRYSVSQVASLAPNELGLYDMSGNVNEWCADYYGEYSSYDQHNPEEEYGVHKVLRGGSWLDSAKKCRVAYRNHIDPSYTMNKIGFRVACIPD